MREVSGYNEKKEKQSRIAKKFGWITIVIGVLLFWNFEVFTSTYIDGLDKFEVFTVLILPPSILVLIGLFVPRKWLSALFFIGAVAFIAMVYPAEMANNEEWIEQAEEIAHREFHEQRRNKVIEEILNGELSTNRLEDQLFYLVNTGKEGTQKDMDMVYEAAVAKEFSISRLVKLVEVAMDTGYSLPWNWLVDYKAIQANDDGGRIELIDTLMDRGRIDQEIFNQEFISRFPWDKWAYHSFSDLEKTEIRYIQSLIERGFLLREDVLAAHAASLIPMEESHFGEDRTDTEARSFQKIRLGNIAYLFEEMKKFTTHEALVGAIKKIHSQNDEVLALMFMFHNLNTVMEMGEGEYLIHYAVRVATNPRSIDMIINYSNWGDHHVGILARKDADGNRLAYYALKHGLERSIGKLQSYGEDFSSLNTHGDTALRLYQEYDDSMKTKLKVYFKTTVVGWRMLNADHSNIDAVNAMLNDSDYQDVIHYLMDE